MTRRRSLGLTLVETLVVLAIAGLIIAVLLAVLLPSDDRKCRLEAERLAAFLTAASAESVMRDAPVRVVFDMDEGTARREVAKVGADITESLWEEDEKAEVFEVRTPVRFDTVDTAESPGRTGGDAYLVFRGERTEGAVVVLGLEQVFYSVVVPPNGAEVVVEKGRAGRPSAGPPINRELPPMEGLDRPISDKVSSVPLGVADSVPGFNRPGGQVNPSRRPGNNRRTETPPADPGTAPTNNPPPTPPPTPPAVTPDKPPPDPPPEEPSPPSDPDPPQDVPNAIGGSCTTDADCGSVDRWSGCLTGANVCVLRPEGRALRLRDVTVVQPADQQIKGLVEPILRSQVALGRLHLVTYFDSGRVWLVQGQRIAEPIVVSTGQELKQFRQSASFPSYPGSELTDAGYRCDDATRVCEVDFDLEGEVRLFIPKGTQPALGVCGYDILAIQASASIQITVAEGLGALAAEGNTLRLTTVLGSGAARNLIYQGRTLYDLLQGEIPLDGADAEDVADLNGDGVADAWRFVFEGPVEEVWLNEPPSEDPNARPEFCD